MTSEPPVPVWDLTSRITAAIHELESPAGIEILDGLHADTTYWLKAHYEMEHSVPSPSSVMRCRYQMWCYGKGLEQENLTPTSWKMRAAVGVMSEPYWLAVLQLAGLDATVPTTSYQCGPRMVAHPDGMLGSRNLVELKSKTGWGYKEVAESRGGVAFAEYGELVQCQLYMHATGAEWTLYLASPADPSLLQSVLRKRSRYGVNYELPPFYVEWLRRDEQVIEQGLERAEMMWQDQQSDEPPPREFAGIPMDPSGNRNFPCGYCPFLKRCQDQWGFGNA